MSNPKSPKYSPGESGFLTMVGSVGYPTVFDAWVTASNFTPNTTWPNRRSLISWGRTDIAPAPQGYIASGDGYTRRYDEITASIPNKTKCVDDTLLWSDSIEESFFQACNWLNICGTHGITLNPEKFRFAQEKSNLLASRSPMTVSDLAKSS